MVDGDGHDRVAEEVERGSVTPAVGQAPRPHLAGAERGMQVAWKERCTCGPRLAGADRRRTGDQLRRQRRAGWREGVRRSVHSFHIRIVRSMNVLNNGTLGPTVDHLPERLSEHDWLRYAKGLAG